MGLKITATCVQNLMKIYHAFHKLLVGGHIGRHTDWWFYKPTFIFGK